MMAKTITFISHVATVVLIAVAIRWLFSAKGTAVPMSRHGSNVYKIKRQWRAIGFAGAAFWIAVSVWEWHDTHQLDRGMVAITGICLAIGLWIASGLVTTTTAGITKRVLWRSTALQWGKITEVKLHKRDGGAIELRSADRKIIIDSRFNAFRHLQKEIEDRTGLKPL